MVVTSYEASISACKESKKIDQSGLEWRRVIGGLVSVVGAMCCPRISVQNQVCKVVLCKKMPSISDHENSVAKKRRSDDSTHVHSVSEKVDSDNNDPHLNTLDGSVETNGHVYELKQITESQVGIVEPVAHHGHGPSKLAISNNEAIIHILKGNIGTGILAMPEAFKHAGITVGSFGLALIALMCVHCMHLLLKSARLLCEKVGVKSMDYATVAEQAFVHGPIKVRKYSKAVRYLTNGFICVTQFGFCTVYFTFVAQNIETTIKSFRPDFDWSYKILMCFILIPLIPLNMIRNLKYLAPASLLANLLQVTALIIIFYYLFQDVPPLMTVKQFGSWEGIPLFFGTAVFAFEGIALIMPVENSMREPKAFGGFLGVLNTCMIWTVCLYIAMGFYGYLKFGDEVMSSITLNLPDEILADIVRIFYATSIFISYAIQFYVPMSIMWPVIVDKYHLDKKPSGVLFGLEALFRLIFILITFALGAAIPDFGIVISLVGSFGGAYLSMMLPAALETVTFWESGISRLAIFKNIVISIIGLIGLVTGLYSTAIAIQANHED